MHFITCGYWSYNQKSVADGLELCGVWNVHLLHSSAIVLHDLCTTLSDRSMGVVVIIIPKGSLIKMRLAAVMSYLCNQLPKFMV